MMSVAKTIMAKANGGVAAQTYSLPFRPKRTPPMAHMQSAIEVEIPMPWRISSSATEASPISRVCSTATPGLVRPFFEMAIAGR